MSAPASDESLIFQLCRSLAVHCVESENLLKVTAPGDDPDLEAEVAEARRLIAEAGYDFDDLYPPADRPVVMEVQ